MERIKFQKISICFFIRLRLGSGRSNHRNVFLKIGVRQNLSKTLEKVFMF